MTKDNPVAAGVAELLPCPFCGGEAERQKNPLHGDMSIAHCKQCGAEAYDRKWNRRAASPVQAGIDPLVAEMESWLLVKRDLYERPDHMGYTGIRDEAGRYTEEDAKASVGDGDYGVSMVRLSEAPEFRKAAFHDLVIKHLTKQRDAAEILLAEAREALELAEDVLSRPPYSNHMWPNGMHPQVGMEFIRATLSRLKPGEKGGE